MIYDNKYSWEETILCLSNSKKTINLCQRAAKSIKAKLYIAEKSSDVLGVPYFYAVIEPKLLDDKITEGLFELLKYAEKREIAVFFAEKPNFKIPGTLKKFFIISRGILDFEKLKLLILNKYTSCTRHNKLLRSFDKRIFRLLYIRNELMKKSRYLTTTELTTTFNVSDKTIFRDIDLLNQLGEGIEYERTGKRWKMISSFYDVRLKTFKY